MTRRPEETFLSDAALISVARLRLLAAAACQRHDSLAARAIDERGDSIGPVLLRMLTEDIAGADESRGMFAVWLLAEIVIHDLMSHPDRRLLISWFAVPPYPTATELPHEQAWYIESTSLVTSVKSNDAVRLLTLALKSACEPIATRAALAWRAIGAASRSDHNPRGATSRHQFATYQAGVVDGLLQAAETGVPSLRRCAVQALCDCVGQPADWPRLVAIALAALRDDAENLAGDAIRLLDEIAVLDPEAKFAVKSRQHLLTDIQRKMAAGSDREQLQSLLAQLDAN